MMTFQDHMKGAIVTGAVTLGALATPAEAGIVQSSLSPAAQDTAITLIENSEAALEGAAEGIRAGEDAAQAEPVPAPESAEHSEPPDGVDVDAFRDAWTDTDAMADVSDQADADSAIGDPGLGGVL